MIVSIRWVNDRENLLAQVVDSSLEFTPLEIWIFCWKFYFSADFLNFLQIFWISSGIDFGRPEQAN